MIEKDHRRCLYFKMGKERKKAERTEKTETHEEQTCPMTVCAVKTINSRIRTVKPKERIQVIPTRSSPITEKATPACMTSGNILKIYINLMPVLALVNEPVEEEEEEKEVNSSPTETDNRNKKDPPVTKSVEQTVKTEALTMKRATETKRPGLVLPPLTVRKPALESCVHQENKMCFTPRPPITLGEQPTTMCSNITPKGCDDGRLWMDNPLLSRSVSLLHELFILNTEEFACTYSSFVEIFIASISVQNIQPDINTFWTLPVTFLFSPPGICWVFSSWHILVQSGCSAAESHTETSEEE